MQPSGFNIRLIELLRKTSVLILIAIMALAIFLRFFQLASYPPALFSDVAVNGINTLQATEQGQWKVFYSENNGREGLFINMQAVAVKLFGPEAWALYAVSSLLGSLTVLGLFLLVRELFLVDVEGSSEVRRRVMNPTHLALLASFFLATSFWHILFSRIGFRAISAPFWGVWAFYFMLLAWRYLSRPSDPAAPPAILKNGILWFTALLGGIFFGLGFHSYIAYRAMPAVVGVLFLYQLIRAWQKGSVKKFLVYATLVVIGGIIAIAPLMLYFVKNPQDFLGRTSQVSVMSSKSPITDLMGNIGKTAQMFNFIGDSNQRQNMTGHPVFAWLAGQMGRSQEEQDIVNNLGRSQLFWPVGILFVWGFYLAVRRVFFAGLQKIIRRDAREVWLANEATPSMPSLLLLSWFAVSSLPVVISNEGIPHALRSILMIPPVFVFAAMGGRHFYDWIMSKFDGDASSQRVKTALKAFVTLCLAACIADAYISYFVAWGPDPRTAGSLSDDYNAKAYELRALPNELPKYVIVEPGDIGINVTQFLTDTYTVEKQKEKNYHYIGPNDPEATVPPLGAYVTGIK